MRIQLPGGQETYTKEELVISHSQMCQVDYSQIEYPLK